MAKIKKGYCSSRKHHTELICMYVCNVIWMLALLLDLRISWPYEQTSIHDHYKHYSEQSSSTGLSIFCFFRKREEERRREAKQQLSLAEAEQKQQISLTMVRVGKLSLDVTEQSVEVKGHKHRKTFSAHNSQSQNRREKQHRAGGSVRHAQLMIVIKGGVCKF